MPGLENINTLGVSGLCLWILWMAYRLFVQRLKEKDAEHAQERKEFLGRLDARDEAFAQLNTDVRNNLAATLVESSNVIKQAVIRLDRRTRKK